MGANPEITPKRKQVGNIPQAVSQGILRQGEAETCVIIYIWKKQQTVQWSFLPFFLTKY